MAQPRCRSAGHSRISSREGIVIELAIVQHAVLPGPRIVDRHLSCILWRSTRVVLPITIPIIIRFLLAFETSWAPALIYAPSCETPSRSDKSGAKHWRSEPWPKRAASTLASFGTILDAELLICFSLESKHVTTGQRGGLDVSKRTCPAEKTNRITLRIAPGCRFVVTEVVVVQPACFVGDLPRETEVEGLADPVLIGVYGSRAISKCLTQQAPAPDRDIPPRIDQCTRRVQMVELNLKSDRVTFLTMWGVGAEASRTARAFRFFTESPSPNQYSRRSDIRTLRRSAQVP